MTKKKKIKKSKANTMRSDCSSDSTDFSADEERQRKNTNVGAGGGGRKSNAIVSRPKATAGYWLCCLLPITLATHYINVSDCTPPATYKMLTIAAASMCVETLCFFVYMFMDTGLMLKLVISFLPGMFATYLYKIFLQQTWGFGVFWGFAVTFCYQNAYIRVLRRLPRCFTFGEAAVLVQGLMLFVLNAVLQLPTLIFGTPATGEFAELNAIMLCALTCLLLVCFLLATFKFLRQPVPFYGLMFSLLLAVTCIPITKPFPLITLFNFIVADNKRINIILFYISLVGLTICTIWWQLRNIQKASTSVRKIFHLLIVLVYVPGLVYQCAFLYIATGVALAIFTVLELVRITKVPPLASTLENAFASFSDEKDAGLLALTPFCLLIGCSLPIWISPCPCAGDAQSILPLLSGILAIGCGDTAASVIGSKFGRIKWRNSSRTLEGTVAFVIAVLLAVFTLNYFGYIALSHYACVLTLIATILTAIIEAYTDQIDNLVLPLVFYAIVNLI